MAAAAVDEAQLRDLIPGVLAALVHRGADFATAEDAVQEALVRAVETWPDPDHPDDPKGWLITTAWRRFIDLTRSDIARRRREQSGRPTSRRPGPTESADDTLQLYFLCAHPSLTARVGRRADAAGRRRPHHPPDRAGVPRARIDDGPADQPGQTHRERRPARSATATCAPCFGRCTWCSTRATAAMSTSPPRRSGWPGSWPRPPTTPRSPDSSHSSCSTTRDAPPVAVGEADGPQAGLAALAELDPTLPRHTASAAYFHERAGDIGTATKLYAEAATQAQSLAERNHLTLRAATLRQRLSGQDG